MNNIAAYALMLLIPLGLYWLWVSIQIEFWMFVFGLAGPLVLIALLLEPTDFLGCLSGSLIYLGSAFAVTPCCLPIAHEYGRLDS